MKKEMKFDGWVKKIQKRGLLMCSPTIIILSGMNLDKTTNENIGGVYFLLRQTKENTFPFSLHDDLEIIIRKRDSEHERKNI